MGDGQHSYEPSTHFAMTKLSNIISTVFHPLLMTTYLVLLLGFFFPPMLMLPKDKVFVFASVIFGITFVLPVVNILIFKQFNMISSLTMMDRKDRIVPFIFITALYVAVAALFYYRIHLSANFTKIMAVTAAMVVFACIITFFFKVSIHSLAIWGALGIILPLNKAAGAGLISATVFLLVAAGLVMAARLQLNAHTPREILVGALVGLCTGFGGMVILF